MCSSDLQRLRVDGDERRVVDFNHVRWERYRSGYRVVLGECKQRRVAVGHNQHCRQNVHRDAGRGRVMQLFDLSNEPVGSRKRRHRHRDNYGRKRLRLDGYQ